LNAEALGSCLFVERVMLRTELGFREIVNGKIVR
jgi:hypothetical protein